MRPILVLEDQKEVWLPLKQKPKVQPSSVLSPSDDSRESLKRRRSSCIRRLVLVETDLEEEEAPSKANGKEKKAAQLEKPTVKKDLGEESPRNRGGEGRNEEEFYANEETPFLHPLQVQKKEELLLSMGDFQPKEEEFIQETNN